MLEGAKQVRLGATHGRAFSRSPRRPADISTATIYHDEFGSLSSNSEWVPKEMFKRAMHDLHPEIANLDSRYDFRHRPESARGPAIRRDHRYAPAEAVLYRQLSRPHRRGPRLNLRYQRAADHKSRQAPAAGPRQTSCGPTLRASRTYATSSNQARWSAQMQPPWISRTNGFPVHRTAGWATQIHTVRCVTASREPGHRM